VRTFSSVVVEFAHDAERLIAGFDKLFQILGAAIEKRYGIASPYDLRSILLSCDPGLLPSSAINTDFTIQRRAEVSFSQNRYFCTGPFPTDEMLDLLAQIEQALLQTSASEKDS